jgi:hypothetical protein
MGTTTSKEGVRSRFRQPPGQARFLALGRAFSGFAGRAPERRSRVSVQVGRSGRPDNLRTGSPARSSPWCPRRALALAHERPFGVVRAASSWSPTRSAAAAARTASSAAAAVVEEVEGGGGAPAGRGGGGADARRALMWSMVASLGAAGKSELERALAAALFPRASGRTRQLGDLGALARMLDEAAAEERLALGLGRVSWRPVSGPLDVLHRRSRRQPRRDQAEYDGRRPDGAPSASRLSRRYGGWDRACRAAFDLQEGRHLSRARAAVAGRVARRGAARAASRARTRARSAWKGYARARVRLRGGRTWRAIARGCPTGRAARAGAATRHPDWPTTTRCGATSAAGRRRPAAAITDADLRAGAAALDPPRAAATAADTPAVALGGSLDWLAGRTAGPGEAHDPSRRAFDVRACASCARRRRSPRTPDTLDLSRPMALAAERSQLADPRIARTPRGSSRGRSHSLRARVGLRGRIGLAVGREPRPRRWPRLAAIPPCR